MRLLRVLVVGSICVCAAGAIALGLFLYEPDFSIEDSTVLIPGGSAVLGSREGAGDEQPREVSLPSFRIGRYEVTAAEYAVFLDDTGSVPPPGGQFVRWGGNVRARLTRRGHPVHSVRYDEAEAYCRWLGRRTGKRVRLPSEDEWEWAARGGIDGAPFPWGWGDAEGKAVFRSRGSLRVGRREPNSYGLYDMAGNVFEWCAAIQAPGMFTARGGSWAERSTECLRVFDRAFFDADYADGDVGFRVLVEEGEERCVTDSNT